MSEVHFHGGPDLDAFLKAHGDQAEEVEKNLLQREPAFVKGLVEGPALGLVTWLGATSPSSTAGQVTGAIVAVVVFLTNWVLRQYIAPAWKLHTGRDLPLPDSEVTDEVDDEYEPDRAEPHEPDSPEQQHRLAGRPQPGRISD